MEGYSLTSYWAVIGDLVRSRAITNRPAFQARLEAVLEQASHQYGGSLASEWTVTLGDEFQALFHSPAEIPFAVEHICHGLTRHGVRFGIGYGPLATALKPRAVGMDGPCFHQARAAIQAAKRLRKSVVVQPDEAAARRVTDIWNLALAVTKRRTGRQSELVELYRAEHTQSKVALRLAVTQGTVSSELSRGLFAEVTAVLEHITAMLVDLTGERRA